MQLKRNFLKRLDYFFKTALFQSSPVPLHLISIFGNSSSYNPNKVGSANHRFSLSNFVKNLSQHIHFFQHFCKISSVVIFRKALIAKHPISLKKLNKHQLGQSTKRKADYANKLFWEVLAKVRYSFIKISKLSSKLTVFYDLWDHSFR